MKNEVLHYVDMYRHTYTIVVIHSNLHGNRNLFFSKGRLRVNNNSNNNKQDDELI